MAEPLLSAVRCVLFWAAANAGLYFGYGRLRRWHAALPLARQSAASDVRALAIGAVAGQVAVAPFLLWRDATPLAEGLACSAWVAPFFLPLYLPLGVPALAVGVGRRLPQLLAGVALLTAAVLYSDALVADRGWAELLACGEAAAVGLCGLLTFQWATRYAVATRFVLRDWETQGQPMAGSQFLAWLHMVAGIAVAALLLCNALGWLKPDWWLLSTLTLVASPSLPNPLSERFGRPVDPASVVKQYVGLLVAVFFFMVLLPIGPIAWGMANQLWWLTAPDWLSIDLLEEAQDTPAAWPLLLQWSLVRDRPPQGGRPLGAGPPPPNYGTATAAATARPPPPPTAPQSPSPPSPPPPPRPAPPAPPDPTPPPPAPPPAAAPPRPTLSDRELRARAAEERLRRLQELPAAPGYDTVV